MKGTASRFLQKIAEPVSGGLAFSMTLTHEQLYREVGGPEGAAPILLLHGWGSSAELMRPIATGLQDRYRVYNLDLPGHGKSPLPPSGWGVPAYVDVVEAFIRAEIGGPVTIIGHSNGGRIALTLASDPARQHLVRRLVLVSPSGVTPKRSWQYYLRKYTAQALKAPFQVLPGPLRDFGLDWLRHSLVWKLLGSSDYRALQGVMREVFVQTVNFHVDDRLAQIQAPTLLFWGDRDTAVSRHQMAVLEQRISGAGLVVLEGAGHYGYLDQPARFLAATRYFLEHS
jgi:pimeloyl-ACP methyl ester carboxylesterase